MSLSALTSLAEMTAELPPPTPLAPDAALDVAEAAPTIMPGEQEVGVRIRATWAPQ